MNVNRLYLVLILLLGLLAILEALDIRALHRLVDAQQQQIIENYKAGWYAEPACRREVDGSVSAPAGWECTDR